MSIENSILFNSRRSTFLLQPAQPRPQVAQGPLDTRNLGPQVILGAAHVQRHVERPMLGNLKLQRPQIAPLNLQQRLMMADLLDQLFLIHTLLPSAEIMQRNRRFRTRSNLYKR